MIFYIRKMSRAGSWYCSLVLAVLILLGCESAGQLSASKPKGRIGVVVVDAGHGGHDRGARAVFGQNEKELTLDTSRRLATALRQRGFRVVETRSGDHFVPLARRVAISNAIRRNDVVFVSVHYNWARRKQASGVEVFHNGSPMAQRMAVEVTRRLERVTPAGERRGAKRGNYHVLRENRKPAILVEPGFLSNASDNRFIQSAVNRQRIAEAIVDGIVAINGGRTGTTSQQRR